MNPITSEKNKLGFVGVGYMGRPIVQRLLKSGFKWPLMTGTAARRRS
jgi:3-hydroxyisobutyrate dehydrogenase-like beta-hydroxyacid dehydrogenase